MARKAKVKIEDVNLTQEQEEFLVNNINSKLAKLSGKHTYFFSEESYPHSIKAAFDWRDSYNKKEDKPDKIVLVDYFPQTKGGKNIFISYNLEKK